jgi:hypothetical protein
MPVDLRCDADRLRACAPNAVNRLQRDLGVLVVGNIYTCYYNVKSVL